MAMLKNKEQVLKVILRDLDTSAQNMQAFRKLEDMYERGDEVSTEKALKACAKSIRHMNDLNQRLLMLLLVYVSGNHYDSDVGSVLVKMGRGEDALREMFKRKMGGQ